MSTREIKAALRPVKRRLRMRRAAAALSFGALAAALWALICAGASFLTPVERLLPLCALGGLFCLLPPLAALLLPVSDLRAAAAADAAGLNERALTALTNPGDAPIDRLQKEDALERLRSLDARAALPMPRCKRRYAWAAAAAALFLLALLLPNPQDAALRERARLQKELQKLAETAREAPEQAQFQGLSEEEMQALRALTAKLADELAAARDSREALKALSEAQREADALQRALSEAALRRAAAALQGAGLSGASKLLGGEGADAAEAAREALSQAAQSAQAAQAAGEALDTLSEAPGEMGEAAAQAAQALAQQNLSQLQGALAKMQGAAGQARAGAASAASANPGQLINQRRAQLAKAQSGASSAGQGQDGSSQGQSAASGQGQGKGQGGIGQGQGEGSGGGAGKGSTNQDLSGASSDGRQRGQGDGAPSLKMRPYEKIYDPTRLDGA